ncbi:MAG: FHA domain-containing protein [Planctomycetes bacterium]|nr:FHA domain-containing protein [Planctomycetota bacterium]
MRIQIEHLSGSRGGEVQTFEDVATVHVGRGAGNDLAFDPQHDLAVSSRHADLLCDGQQCFVMDVGSRNGTFVNGRRVTQAPLAPGDVVQFGEGGPQVRIGLEETEPEEEEPEGPGERTLEFMALKDTHRRWRRGTWVLVAVLLLGVAGGVAWSLVASSGRRRQAAEASRAVALKERSGAEAAGAAERAVAVWGEAVAAWEGGERALKDGDWAGAREGFDAAASKWRAAAERVAEDERATLAAQVEEQRRLYEEYRDKYQQLVKDAARERTRLTERWDADRTALLEQQATLEQALADREGRRQELEARLAATEKEAERARIQIEIAALGKEVDQEALRLQALRQRYWQALVYLRTVVYFEEPSTRREVVIAEGAGAGFFISRDGTVATAKHVVQPWKFDAQAMAWFSKMGETPIPMQSRIDVWAAREEGDRLVFQQVATLRSEAVIGIASDSEARKETARILWDAKPVDLSVAVQGRGPGDVALVATGLAPGAVVDQEVPKEPEPGVTVAVLGCGSAVGGVIEVVGVPGRLTASSRRGHEVALLDLAGLEGAPCLALDGACLGMVAGKLREGATSVVPLSRVLEALGE